MCLSVNVRAVFVFVSEHLCVSEDPLKADACFRHAGKNHHGKGSVCVLARGERGTQVADISALRHGSST